MGPGAVWGGGGAGTVMGWGAVWDLSAGGGAVWGIVGQDFWGRVSQNCQGSGGLWRRPGVLGGLWGAMLLS